MNYRSAQEADTSSTGLLTIDALKRRIVRGKTVGARDLGVGYRRSKNSTCVSGVAFTAVITTSGSEPYAFTNRAVVRSIPEAYNLTDEVVSSQVCRPHLLISLFLSSRILPLQNRAGCDAKSAFYGTQKDC